MAIAKARHRSVHINGLMQERLNCSVLAMELHFSCINRPIIYLYIGMAIIHESWWPGDYSHEPLKIQWGPCEILHEGAMDSQNWWICIMYFYVRILQYLLGALGNSNGEGSWPSTKYVYWESCHICIYIYKMLPYWTFQWSLNCLGTMSV